MVRALPELVESLLPEVEDFAPSQLPFRQPFVEATGSTEKFALQVERRQLQAGPESELLPRSLPRNLFESSDGTAQPKVLERFTRFDHLQNERRHSQLQ